MGLDKQLTVGALREYLEMNSNIPDDTPIKVQVWHYADEIERGYSEMLPVRGVYTEATSGQVQLWLET